MDDARCVGFSDCFACLQYVTGGLFSWQYAVLTYGALEIDTLEVLHHHVGRTVVENADIENPRDVLATNFRGGLRLPRETGSRLFVSQHIRTKELYRDSVFELNVYRANDDAHTAFADDRLDTVLTRENFTRSYNG